MGYRFDLKRRQFHKFQAPGKQKTTESKSLEEFEASIFSQPHYTMSKNTVQIDARREEFRKYLEKEGILESLTKVLVALYEEPDKPSDALSFVRNNFAASEMQTMRAQVDNLTKENEQLKTKVTTLEADKAALEKKINEMEEVAAKEDNNKDEAVETSSSPKHVDEIKVP